jgi:uncharacterized UPF0146 family protein
MFDELGDQLRTREEAALLLAQQVADDIVNGRIDAYQGAWQIYFLSPDLDDMNRRAVDEIVLLASLIDDKLVVLTEGERQIKVEAVRFLAKR